MFESIHLFTKGRVLKESDASIEETAVYAKGGARPAVTIRNGNTVLKEGRDYKLKYSKNTSVTEGKTAVVTVKGKGRYKGSFKLYYAIKRQNIESLSSNIIIGDKVESAKGYTDPDLMIYDLDGKKLQKI